MNITHETKMYRAVERKGFDPTASYFPRLTRRLPSNVPYVIDNIWEYLRPQDAPNRRHAVYASPTPALALANASGGGGARNNYVVCELVLCGPACKVAQLAVTDARLHPDIRNLINWLHQLLDDDFADQALDGKQSCATLFLPCATKEELGSFFQRGAWHRDLAERLEAVSTFWADARFSVSAASDGEMFFELQPSAFFRLIPFDATGDNAESTC